MRIQLASALCVVLLSTCSPRPAAAQFNPANTKPMQSFSAKPPVDAKLGAGLQNDELAAAGLASKLRDELAQRARRPFLDRLQEKAVLAPTPSNHCAHILMWKPPLNMDEKIIIEIPDDLSSTITTFPALPPCSKDFRGMLMVPQAPPRAPMSLFIGPQRLGPLFSDPRKPFHQDHPQ